MAGSTLRVDGSDGTTKTTVSAQTAEKVEELKGEMDHGEVELHRDAWADVDEVLERRTDRLIIGDPRSSDPFFAGRFDDTKRGDGTVTVSIAGYERDAKDAEPTSDNVVYQNVDDSAVVTELLGQAPTLEAGTVEMLANNLSMSFSHAEPSKALRDAAEATGAELRYNDNRTVDYVDRRGADRPDVVLSPEAQTIVGDLEITEDAREEVTHIRGFGAQSGPDQVTAEAAANSYDGGKQIWSKYENKDIQEVSRLQRIIDQMVAEYDGEPRHLEVRTSVAGVDVDLGDRVTVEIPTEGIDRTLRVMKRRSILGTAGAVLELTLSNRLLTNSDSGRENRKDLQRFTRGYQGFVDRSQITSGWNAAGDGTPQELVVVNWPDDIVEAKDVTLAVQGRAWRSPIDPQPHDHEVEFTIDAHDHDVTVDATTASGAGDSGYANPLDYTASLPEGDSFTQTFDLPFIDGDGAYAVVYMSVLCQPDSSTSGGGYVRMSNIDTGTEFYDEGDSASSQTSYEIGHHRIFQAVNVGDVEGDTIEVEFYDAFEADYRFSFGGFVMGEHTHSIETTETSENGGGEVVAETTDTTAGASPSVITTFDGEEYHPSDVAIEVNGTQVGTIAGDSSSSWTETIDLKGELDPGLNTISATPSTRGELNLSLASELFRRGRSE